MRSLIIGRRLRVKHIGIGVFVIAQDLQLGLLHYRFHVGHAAKHGHDAKILRQALLTLQYAQDYLEK